MRHTRVLIGIMTFIVFGWMYYGIEILYRGYSHWTMAVLAGIIAILIGGLNDTFSYEMPFDLQIIIGTCFATVFEGIAGVILNIFLGLGIWDYSNLWGTFFFGQCNIFFCVAWAVLSAVCIVLQDCLVYYVLKIDDERPHYHVWNGKILFWLPERK